MIQVIAQIGFGAATGLIAELAKPGRNYGGIFTAASIGLMGSLGGVFAGRSVFGTESNLTCWIVSILGALLMLSLYRVFFGTRTAY